MLKLAKSAPDFFSTPPTLTIRFDAGKIPVNHQAGSYAIESLITLEKLLTDMRLRREDKILRFLVDTSGKAWFAPETRVGINAPKHYQMTGEPINKAQCLTAGNIKFKTSSCKVLKDINHRSGDFQPPFESLRIFLAILILNEDKLPFSLPRVLVVKQLNHEGKTLYKHRWPLSQLKKWMAHFQRHEDLIQILKQQDDKTRTVHYEALNNHNDQPPKPQITRHSFKFFRLLKNLWRQRMPPSTRASSTPGNSHHSTENPHQHPQD